MVPSSRDTCLRATLGAVMKQVSVSFSRRGLERFVISSKSVAPRWSQVNTCLPRKAGSPRELEQARHLRQGHVISDRSWIVPQFRLMRQM